MIYPPPDYIDRRVEQLNRQRQADEALLWECFEALEACIGWPHTIEKLKQRLTLHEKWQR